MGRSLLRLLFLLAVLSAPGGLAGKEFPWADFKKRSLQAATDLDLQALARMKPRGDWAVLNARELVLSVMTARFSGLARPLAQERRELLDRWAIARDYDPAYVERYEQEYLFFQQDRKYWIAVQKSVLPHLLQQIKEGKEVELYLLSGVGGRRVNGQWEVVLLLQEFQLPP